MSHLSNHKTKTIKYGKVPEKEAESEPWDKLCVDLIGPYKINLIKKRLKPRKEK